MSFWTPERDALLTKLWPDESKTVNDIGDEIGCSGAYCSVRASQIGLPTRVKKAGYVRIRERDQSVVRSQPHFTFVGEQAKYVADSARRRGLLVQVLLHVIVSTVINDKMIDAVLDDADTVEVLSRSIKTC